MRRLALVTAAFAVMLGGCGSGGASYIPAAWGPPGYCYYVASPYECYGHHPGVPALMPLLWHERYAAYYDSPAYIDVYVPPRYQSYATSRARTFERAYGTAIKAQARAATWRNSANGKTVAGTKVSRSATFGSGGARSTGFSGGSFRSGSSASGNPCALAHGRMLLARGGSSGGGSSAGRSGGSFGGGSARSGGSVGSRSGSRSGRNC